jgi:hypothetical protein
VLDEGYECLVEAGSSANRTGDVSGFAPPGDIHRVRNAVAKAQACRLMLVATGRVACRSPTRDRMGR